jgi:hypothetical protein
MKCVQCDKKIEKDRYWCSLECKKSFVLDKYNTKDLIKWATEKDNNQSIDEKKIRLNLKKYVDWKEKNPHKNIKDYIMGM